MKIPRNLPINNLGSLTEKTSDVQSKLKLDLPGGYVFAPSLLQALAMVVLIFLLILTMGQLRRRYADWHLAGILPGVLFGFILAIIFEAILVISGRTIFTTFIGWNSAPKPISNLLDAGQTKLKKTLGVSPENIKITNQKKSVYEIEKEINQLTLQEKMNLVQGICEQ